MSWLLNAPKYYFLKNGAVNHANNGRLWKSTFSILFPIWYPSYSAGV